MKLGGQKPGEGAYLNRPVQKLFPVEVHAEGIGERNIPADSRHKFETGVTKEECSS